jgi:hypothetical protein
LVGADGLAEFKCPKTTTHLQYLVDGVVPDEYRPQMYWQMACCGREWCDFVSHDPRMKDESLQTMIVRLPRDNAIIATMEAEVLVFLAEVDEMLARLTAKKEERC